MKKEALTIMGDIAKAYGITVDDIRSRSRVARLATARAVTCYILNRYLGMSTNEVGRAVFRTHAAVMHDCRVVESFYLWPKMYATDISIIEEIKGKHFGKENG